MKAASLDDRDGGMDMTTRGRQIVLAGGRLACCTSVEPGGRTFVLIDLSNDGRGA